MGPSTKGHRTKEGPRLYDVPGPKTHSDPVGEAGSSPQGDSSITCSSKPLLGLAHLEAVFPILATVESMLVECLVEILRGDE